MVHLNYNNLSNSSGVYLIFNNHNWRVYVGSTMRFKTRWTQGHIDSLLRGKHQNKFLQADFNKCRQELGHDNFLEFHILENMPGSTREERLEKEDIWLKIHFDGGKNCYNLKDRAISREGYKSANPEETRKKKSEISKRMWLSLIYRQKKVDSMTGAKNWNFGKSLSLETKAKLREARLRQVFTAEQIMGCGNANRGKSRNKETKQKISEKRKARIVYRKIAQLTRENEVVKIFNTVQEAAEETGLWYTNIMKAAQGHYSHSGGFIWKFEE